MDGLEPALLAGGLIQGNTQYIEPLVLVFLPGGDHIGVFLPARAAPGSPEIDQQVFTAEGGQCNGTIQGIVLGEIGGNTADGHLLRLRNSTGHFLSGRRIPRGLRQFQEDGFHFRRLDVPSGEVPEGIHGNGRPGVVIQEDLVLLTNGILQQLSLFVDPLHAGLILIATISHICCAECPHPVVVGLDRFHQDPIVAI